MKTDMEIVIIGAGVAGLSIGWRLLQAGAKVTILERAQAGSGATWAAAGMIALAGELEKSPPVEIAFARQSNGLWPDFVKEVDRSMRENKYTASIWKQRTGKTLDELWQEYTTKPQINL